MLGADHKGHQHKIAKNLPLPLSELAQPLPPLSVGTQHKFRKIQSFLHQMCGRPHLKEPAPPCPHWTTPLPPECGRPPTALAC